MTINVLVAGGVSFDTIIHLEGFPEPHQATLFARESCGAVGGTSSGKALNLAALGYEVTLAAQLGSDRFGDLLRARFLEAGVEELSDHRTEQHTNLMNAGGERITIFTVQRTFDPTVQTADFQAAVRRADVVVLDIINWSRQLIPLAKALGKPVWSDLHDYDGENVYHRDYLDAADYVFLSAEALPAPEYFARDLIARGKELVVMTRGVAGAVALTATGQRFEVESVRAFGASDTNGAGDAFLAGYLHGHAGGRSVPCCLELASLTAALCVASRELVHPELSAQKLEGLRVQHVGDVS